MKHFIFLSVVEMEPRAAVEYRHSFEMPHMVDVKPRDDPQDEETRHLTVACTLDEC